MKNGLLPPEGETLAEELASPDREIVKRAIAGDKDAFSALFRLTYKQMFFAARKILRRDEDIYDAISIDNCIKAKKSEGSTSFESVEKQLSDLASE